MLRFTILKTETDTGGALPREDHSLGNRNGNFVAHGGAWWIIYINIINRGRKLTTIAGC